MQLLSILAGLPSQTNYTNFSNITSDSPKAQNEYKNKSK